MPVAALCIARVFLEHLLENMQEILRCHRLRQVHLIPRFDGPLAIRIPRHGTDRQRRQFKLVTPLAAFSTTVAESGKSTVKLDPWPGPALSA